MRTIEVGESWVGDARIDDQGQCIVTIGCQEHDLVYWQTHLDRFATNYADTITYKDYLCVKKWLEEVKEWAANAPALRRPSPVFEADVDFDSEPRCIENGEFYTICNADHLFYALDDVTRVSVHTDTEDLTRRRCDYLPAHPMTVQVTWLKNIQKLDDPNAIEALRPGMFIRTQFAEPLLAMVTSAYGEKVSNGITVRHFDTKGRPTDSNKFRNRELLKGSYLVQVKIEYTNKPAPAARKLKVPATEITPKLGYTSLDQVPLYQPIIRMDSEGDFRDVIILHSRERYMNSWNFKYNKPWGSQDGHSFSLHRVCLKVTFEDEPIAQNLTLEEIREGMWIEYNATRYFVLKKEDSGQAFRLMGVNAGGIMADHCIAMTEDWKFAVIHQLKTKTVEAYPA